MDDREHETDEERQVRELLAEADRLLTENADGTVIVQLTTPVKLGQETVSRVTLRRVNVGDIRATRGAVNRAEAHADRLASPRGIVEAIEAEVDHVAVIRGVDRQLGKYQRAGRNS